MNLSDKLFPLEMKMVPIFSSKWAICLLVKEKSQFWVLFILTRCLFQRYNEWVTTLSLVCWLSFFWFFQLWKKQKKVKKFLGSTSTYWKKRNSMFYESLFNFRNWTTYISTISKNPCWKTKLLCCSNFFYLLNVARKCFFPVNEEIEIGWMKELTIKYFYWC